MGLDIYTTKPSNSMRVGSYSSVQTSRIKATELFAKKLAKIEPAVTMSSLDYFADFSDELLLREALKNSDHIDGMRLLYDTLRAATEDCGDVIDYEYFPITHYLYDFTKEREDAYNIINRALCGLNAWVDHSDCDGVHSPGEALDVSLCLHWIAEVVPEKDDESYFDRDYWLSLADFYQFAAKNEQLVYFG